VSMTTIKVLSEIARIAQYRRGSGRPPLPGVLEGLGACSVMWQKSASIEVRSLVA
jgi:hypothetical protein